MIVTPGSPIIRAVGRLGDRHTVRPGADAVKRGVRMRAHVGHLLTCVVVRRVENDPVLVGVLVERRWRVLHDRAAVRRRGRLRGTDAPTQAGRFVLRELLYTTLVGVGVAVVPGGGSHDLWRRGCRRGRCGLRHTSAAGQGRE